MDILCTRCGEPWDIYSLVDDMAPEEARKLKAGKGCPCCINLIPCNSEAPSCKECDCVGRFGICQVRMFRPIFLAALMGRAIYSKEVNK